MSAFTPASFKRPVHALTQNPVGKRGLLWLRVAIIQALTPIREFERLRRALNLPANSTIDPLRIENPRGMRIIQTRVHGKFRRALPILPADPKVLPHFRARAWEYPEREYVTILERGSAWGYVHGAVFTSDGEFVPSFARDPWGPRLHQVWTRAHLPQPKRIKGRALYLVTPEATDNYHHWMIDLLPRIGMVTRAGFSIEAFDHVILSHANRAYQWETLTRLGVKKEQVIQVSPSVRLQPDELIVPSLKGTNEQIPSEHVRFLREAFLGRCDAKRGEAKRKIFLSRKDAPSRKLANEDEVFACLQPLGFESVSLSGRTVREQARLFSEAEIIVGPSGAAFANLVFASPGTRVIEFATPSWLTVYHWMISARRGLPHTMIMAPGGPPPKELNITGRAGDLVADISKLKSVLANLPAEGANASRVKNTGAIRTGFATNGASEILGSSACASL